MLDLKDLARRVDEALEKETSESMLSWLEEKKIKALKIELDDLKAKMGIDGLFQNITNTETELKLKSDSGKFSALDFNSAWIYPELNLAA